MLGTQLDPKIGRVPTENGVVSNGAVDAQLHRVGRVDNFDAGLTADIASDEFLDTAAGASPRPDRTGVAQQLAVPALAAIGPQLEADRACEPAQEPGAPTLHPERYRRYPRAVGKRGPGGRRDARPGYRGDPCHFARNAEIEQEQIPGSRPMSAACTSVKSA